MYGGLRNHTSLYIGTYPSAVVYVVVICVRQIKMMEISEVMQRMYRDWTEKQVSSYAENW